MLNKLGKQCMYFLNEFVILIFLLICSSIYLTMLFYPLHYMVVKYGALKIAKLLKSYIMIINLRKSTPLYIMYTLHPELGRHLIQINIK